MKYSPLLITILLALSAISTMGYVLIYPDVTFYCDNLTVEFKNDMNFSYVDWGNGYFYVNNTNISTSDTVTINISCFSEIIGCSNTLLQFNTSNSATFNYTGFNPALILDITDDGTTIYNNVETYNDGSIIFTGNGDIKISIAGFVPDLPYNGSSTYNTTLNSVNLTWTGGNYSDKYIVELDGTEIQNSTSTFYNESSVSSSGIYIVWGWNTTCGTKSLTGLTINWGALIINIYNESQPWIKVEPFNLLISSYDGSNTYQNNDNTNPVSLDLLDIPYGIGTAIIITSDEYQRGVYYYDLTPNIFYNLTLYLTPVVSNETGGSGGGSGGDGDTNTTQSTLYYIRVVETIQTEYTEVDRGVENARVYIRRYINTTDTYQNISILITDANGYCNVYLIPSVLYKVEVTKTGYDEMFSDYIPAPPNEFGQTELKTFRLIQTIEDTTDIIIETLFTNITYTFEPTGTRHKETFTFYYNITSSDNKLEWYRMTVHYYNDSNSTWITLSEQTGTNAGGGSLSYTIPNETGRYSFECYFKKEGYDEHEFGETGSLLHFYTLLHAGLETLPDYAWYIVIIIIMIVVMGICLRYFSTGIATGYIGLMVMAVMLLFKDVSIPLGGTGSMISGWLILGITLLMYTMGVFLWSRI